MKSNKYDVVVVGSGLGGLVTALILSKAGKKVCVLEKNNQYGGNLQTFVRDKTLFDTGVHYIGGLGKGENLYRFFDYLGIAGDLKLQQLDPNAYDVISFDGDDQEYPHAQGADNFVKQLLQYFPEEQQAIQAYVEKLDEICHSFPLYYLQEGKAYDEAVLGISAKAYFDSLTNNEKLKAVWAGSNFLYAGDAATTPLYVHALCVNSYITSAWRCIQGGSQISRLLIRELRKFGAEVYKHAEVSQYTWEDNRLVGCTTLAGTAYFADTLVSNINLKTTLHQVGEEHFSKPFVKRIQSLAVVPSVFSVYLVFKPNSMAYRNYNCYHFENEACVWQAAKSKQIHTVPMYVATMNCSEPNPIWADSMTVMTYMSFDEVAQWENTHNRATPKNSSSRGEEYEAFKRRRESEIIEKLKQRFPEIGAAIASVHSSTPLSYRDFIGAERGNMYGFVKEYQNPMKSFIAPRTKIDNLFLTGQNVRMHGILGVTIGAFATCSEILGKEYLQRELDNFVKASS